jgi:hypothetical protein
MKVNGIPEEYKKINHQSSGNIENKYLRILSFSENLW